VRREITTRHLRYVTTIATSESLGRQVTRYRIYVTSVGDSQKEQ
jgi:hypothetical protein